MYQILKNHFSRYTPEMVERYCGVPKELFLKLAETYCSASGPEKTGVICYAVGWTQHSRGVQMIRAAAILQLLLGNIGRPGGGILALRGHASIQGSTDIPTLYDILPEARSETWFMYHLGRRLREKASKDPRPRNAGLSALTWNYATEGQHQEPKVEEVLQEINGYTLPDRKLVSGFAELQADGSTACGCWIYSGCFHNLDKTRRTAALLTDGTATAGGLHGLPTAASSTIALRRVQTERPGVSARS